MEEASEKMTKYTDKISTALVPTLKRTSRTESLNVLIVMYIDT